MPTQRVGSSTHVSSEQLQLLPVPSSCSNALKRRPAMPRIACNHNDPYCSTAVGLVPLHAFMGT